MHNPAPTRCLIFDLDTTLPFPTYFHKYVTETFRSDLALRPEHHRYVSSFLVLAFVPAFVAYHFPECICMYRVSVSAYELKYWPFCPERQNSPFGIRQNISAKWWAEGSKSAVHIPMPIFTVLSSTESVHTYTHSSAMHSYRLRDRIRKDFQSVDIDPSGCFMAVASKCIRKKKTFAQISVPIFHWTIACSCRL